MENEIMETEQAMDELVSVAEDSAKDLLLTATVGIVVLVGGIIAYKKIVKPLIAKAKEKREQEQEAVIEAEFTEPVEDEVEAE